MMRWFRRWNFKRAFAIIALCVIAYMGVERFTAIVHADRCIDSGGSYDPQRDLCRR